MSLFLSPPLSGSKKTTKIWNYQLSNLGYLPISFNSDESTTRHEVTGKRIKVNKKKQH